MLRAAFGVATALTIGLSLAIERTTAVQQADGAVVLVTSRHFAATGAGPAALRIDGWFIETDAGRVPLPASLTPAPDRSGNQDTTATLADGRRVRLQVRRTGDDTTINLSAEPAAGVKRWGMAVDAQPDEYFTGLMERVVDGPQQASWAPEITQAMNLRGQSVDMIVKPTTSVYAPFYLSSRHYGLDVGGTWPGRFDFAKENSARVNVAFEGSAFGFRVFTGATPMAIVRAHALAAGPPVLPPKWAFGTWRWRDEHRQRTQYYDGTPVTGPFNAEVMEDVLMMRAFGIPSTIYWIDRPYGTGPLGYDDFEIDPARLPNFAAMVRWLNEQGQQMLLWIAPFFQGKMAEEATAKGYTLKGQQRPANGNNFPMVDLTNPAAKAYWQEGVAKLLKLGVAAFKLDRSEENIPDDGEPAVADGRSLREQRNAYPVMYAQATAEIARKLRGSDFFIMPRAAYAGSSKYAVFWGGDIGGTQEGLRAEIIGVQRAAVMGYPVWGSDTCGYNQQLMETDVCARWLQFSSMTPLMEVGPTRNVGFWNLPREPAYDTDLITVWRLYARLHTRLQDYSYAQARRAHDTGEPIVRPMFLVDPAAPDAWTNWWTYMYGPDLVVSPIWKKGQRDQHVYLPAGSKWRDAWRPAMVYDGGKTIAVAADVHQLPLFIRDGSRLELGDLNIEYAESQAAARVKPDLKTLDATVRAWADKNGIK